MPKSNKTSPTRWKTIQVKMKQAPMKSQAQNKKMTKKSLLIKLMCSKLFQAYLCLILGVPRWTGLSMMVCTTDFCNGDQNVKIYWNVSLQCLQREEMQEGYCLE